MSLRDLVYEDELTGAHNRRFLTHLFDTRWDELRRRNGLLSMIILDLDSFKAINDTYGHATGDEVLRETASVLRDCFRKDDIIIRYGGDEFVVVLPGVGADEARLIADRARVAAKARRLLARTDGSQIESPIAFSIGIASYPGDGSTGETMLEVADRRLYQDKRSRQRREQLRRRIVPMGALAAMVTIFAVGLMTRRPAENPLAVASPETPQVMPTPDVAYAQAQERIRQMQRQIEELSNRLAAQRPDEDHREFEEQIADYKRLVAELTERHSPTGSVQPTPLDQIVEPTPSVAVVDPAGPIATETIPEAMTSPTTTGPSPSLSLGPPSAMTLLARPGVEVDAAEMESFHIVLPRPRSPIRPDYPPLARQMGKEAVVRLRVVVDRDGRVVATEPYGEAVGFGFDRAAMTAVRKSRFQPGFKDSVPTEMEVIMSFSFVRDGND